MVNNFKAYDGKDKVISSMEMAERISSLPAVPRYKYGIDNIDYLTDGFETGEVITITGWSGYGKTTFCQTLLTNFSRQKLPTLSISYEGKVTQFFRRLPNPLPHFYMPMERRSYDTQWLQCKIAEGVAKYGIKIVLIDHLGFVVSPPKDDYANTYAYNLRLGALYREVHSWAEKYDVTIFMVCHCGKPPKTKDGKPSPRPGKSDLKDSSAIEQESDAVYVIHRILEKKGSISNRHYEGTNETEFQIMKQRENGNIGKITLLTYHNGELIPAISQDEERTFKA